MGNTVRLFAALVLAMGFLGSGCRTLPPENYAVPHPALSLSEFQKYVRAGKVPILDAREPADFQVGYVPDAINFPPGANFYRDYKKLKHLLGPHKEDLVIVYCVDQWCDRADELQLQLIAQGFQHVGRFSGGWLEWQRAKLPETGSR
ncbi:MAG TPA: rhodanese-like domain-containing protein [Candidatus Saccharimonadales bacterium]|nr:rhodanese-like domain-containing protein [Candidatus Saccharimonadales bacterium]